MDSSPQTNKMTSSTLKVVVIAAVIIIALLVAVIVLLMRPQPTADIMDGGIPKVGYANNATVVMDEDSLQAAVDEAVENAKNGKISLLYQNDAFSSDGKTFSCFIANNQLNLYDMFIGLYADEDFSDQLYLSGLVPPGSGFEELTLDHALPAGDNTVYVVLNQVKTDENGQQAITGQVVHTMKFHVG